MKAFDLDEPADGGEAEGGIGVVEARLEEIGINAIGEDMDFVGLEVGGKLENGFLVVIADGDGEGALAQELGEEFGERVGEDVVSGKGHRQGNVEQPRGVVAQQQLPHRKVNVKEVEVELIDLGECGIPGEAVL